MLLYTHCFDYFATFKSTVLGDDYTLPAGTSVTYSSGVSASVTECVNISTVDDDALEGDHSFTVFISSTDPSVTIGNLSAQEVTINDNEGSYCIYLLTSV